MFEVNLRPWANNPYKIEGEDPFASFLELDGTVVGANRMITSPIGIDDHSKLPHVSVKFSVNTEAAGLTGAIPTQFKVGNVWFVAEAKANNLARDLTLTPLETLKKIAARQEDA